MSNDPYWDKTIAAIRMDGANGGTVFTDLKGHALTASGGAQTSTAQSKFYGSSGYFNNTGQLVLAASSDWALGVNPWAIDFWCHPTNANQSTLRGLFSLIGNVASYAGMQMVYQSDVQQLTIGWEYLRTGMRYALSSPLQNTWSHLALAYWEGAFTLYLNGIALSGENLGAGVAGKNHTSTEGVWVGTAPGHSGFIGYLCNFRIVKGDCPFRGNFTPPAAFFGYRASGTVKDVAGSFAARIVRAYNRTNGNLVGQAVSSALDGSFDIALVTPDPHYVICLDDDSGDELEALIYDRVLPVL